MKRNNQNARIRNRDTSVRKSYLFVALMTLLGFGILSTVQATQDQSGVPVFKFSPEAPRVYTAGIDFDLQHTG